MKCGTMSNALPENKKIFDDVMTMSFYDVILYFRLGLCRKSRKSELLCFSSDLFGFGIGGSFEMLIKKRKPN